MSIIHLSNSHEKLFHFIFALFIGVFAMVLIHEIGHCISALIFQFEIIEFHIGFFENSFVRVIIPVDAENWKIFIFYISGTLITLIFAILMTIGYYKFHLRSFYEYIFYVFSFLFYADLILYLPIDLLWLKSGDWFDAYQIYPELTIFLILIPIVELILYMIYRKRLIKEVNYDFSY